MIKDSLFVEIDKLTACLEDSDGKPYDTVFYRIEDVNILKGFTKRSHWHVNWSKLYANYDIYALALKDSPLEFQGLAAISNDEDAGVTLLHWAVAAPHNNPLLGTKRYVGVGGHLFAIAIHESIRSGFGGIVIGHPSNKKLYDHYQEKLGAKSFSVGPLAYGYGFTIILEGSEAREVYEKYNFAEIYPS